MRIIRGILTAILLSFVILAAIILSNGTVIRAKNSAEAYDLSPPALAGLKRRAVAKHDQNAASRIYWYYRFTKKDFAEAAKWDYAVGPATDVTNAPP